VRRVEQLIALATDPAASEEEARTAALQAARGIVKNGLVVTTREAASAQRGAGAYYDATLTPQGRQLGMGTPQLPPPRSRAPGRSRELPPGEPMARFLEVNLDFKDDVQEVKQDPAFPTALLALLRK